MDNDISIWSWQMPSFLKQYTMFLSALCSCWIVHNKFCFRLILIFQHKWALKAGRFFLFSNNSILPLTTPKPFISLHHVCYQLVNVLCVKLVWFILCSYFLWGTFSFTIIPPHMQVVKFNESKQKGKMMEQDHFLWKKEKYPLNLTKTYLLFIIWPSTCCHNWETHCYSVLIIAKSMWLYIHVTHCSLFCENLQMLLWQNMLGVCTAVVLSKHLCSCKKKAKFCNQS